MMDSITNNLPEIKLDFLPSKREAKKKATFAARAATVMGGAALGVYVSEKMNVPGAPENVVAAKLAEYTSFLGETGQRAAVVSLSTGASYAASTQLDRLRPEDVVEINGEEVPRSRAIERVHEESTELAEALKMDNPEEVTLDEAIGKLESALLAERKVARALEAKVQEQSNAEVRTADFSLERAFALIEVAKSPSEIEEITEGESRDEVLDRAEVIAAELIEDMADEESPEEDRELVEA
jgi:hypothetical protein